MPEESRPARAAVAGLFAAAVTPINASGDPDLATFDRLVDVLVGAGVDGIVVGGATAEYPHFEFADRQALIRRAAQRLPSGKSLLVGIGSASVRHVLDLGRCAIDAGARALLIPMPLFFRYEQHDLQAFCSHVSRSLRAPCLLYDLPDFTNPLATETTIALLEREEYIVGIKDSSGRPERLAALVRARSGAPWSLLVGDDGLLVRGLDAGWDGGISGLASFCPELLVALHRATRAANSAAAATHQGHLEELIGQVSGLPAPWGVRIGLKARGLDTGALPLPLSPTRREQIARFEAWLRGWLERAELPDLLVEK